MPRAAPEQSREGRVPLTVESINDPCHPVPWLMGDTALAPSDSTTTSTLVSDGESLEVWEPVGPAGSGEAGPAMGKAKLSRAWGWGLHWLCRQPSENLLSVQEHPACDTTTGVHWHRCLQDQRPRALPPKGTASVVIATWTTTA